MIYHIYTILYYALLGKTPQSVNTKIRQEVLIFAH